MFEAANDQVFDERVFDERSMVADAQRRQSGIIMGRTAKVAPFYVFQHGKDGNQFGYVTKYGYCNVGFNSYSDAAEAAEEYTQRVE